MPQPDFSGVAVAEQPPEGLVPGLIRKILEAQDVVDLAAAALETATARLTRVTTIEVPEAMRTAGLTEAVGPGGMKLKLADAVNVSVSEENRPAAWAWLRENGHGGVVKSEITIDARGLEADVLQELHERFDELGATIEQKENVHASTLKALVKELLEAGTVMPPTFNVHQYSKASVTIPRLKKGKS